jgi:hypothetical protein
MVRADAGNSAAVAPSQWMPEDYGLLAWSYDPTLATAQLVLGNLEGNYQKVILRKAATISNIHVHVMSGGSGSHGAALYSGAGARLAWSSAVAAAWSSAGYKTMALNTPYVAAAGVYYLQTVLESGAAATLAALPGDFAPYGNVGLVSPNLRSIRDNIGVATPATMTTPQPSGRAPWMGCS